MQHGCKLGLCGKNLLTTHLRDTPATGPLGCRDHGFFLHIRSVQFLMFALGRKDSDYICISSTRLVVFIPPFTRTFN